MSGHGGFELTKSLIIRSYIVFMICVLALFGTGVYVIHRQQQVIDNQSKIITQNNNVIESLRDYIDELHYKMNKQGLLKMSIISMPTVKKFYLAMRDGYIDIMYGDRLIVSLKDPDLYKIRIKDTSFVYYPEPNNSGKRVGYYRTNEYAIKQYTEELVDGIWKVRTEKTVIY